MEYVQPFSIDPEKLENGAEAAVVHLKPTVSKKAKLELVVLYGHEPVFLWRGRKELGAAFRAASIGPDTEFDLGASTTQASTMVIEPDLGMITLFSETGTIGYIRYVEC